MQWFLVSAFLQELNTLTDEECPPTLRHTNFGEIEVQLGYDDSDQSVTCHISRAREIIAADITGKSDPFCEAALFPRRDASHFGKTRVVNATLAPEWHQTLVFFHMPRRLLRRTLVDLQLFDYDRFKQNDFLGQVIIPLYGTSSII